MTLPFDLESVLGSLCDDVPVGVWVARAPGGELVYGNHELARILGAPLGHERIFDGEGRRYPKARLPFTRALEARQVVMADDLVIHHPDGKRVPVRAFARPMFRDGEISHVVIALFDITLQVEAQHKLASGVAHDFNNLLTAIRSITARLAAGEKEPERLLDLRAIDEVAQQAARLTRSLVDPHAASTETDEAPHRTSSLGAPLPLAHGTVLLVEDEQLVRVSTFRVLRQLGYQVIACADGDEAVEIFRERRDDISAVMLDVAMPKMGGRQTYLALRDIDPAVRVLVMAGGTHGGEVEHILALGAREFLPKPFEPYSLSQALARVLHA